MTNLLLAITLNTNVCLTRIDVLGVTNTHLYSIQTAQHFAVEPETNWVGGWIFEGSITGTNSFYDYYFDTNRFYRVQDMGFKF